MVVNLEMPTFYLTDERPRKKEKKRGNIEGLRKQLIKYYT